MLKRVAILGLSCLFACQSNSKVEIVFGGDVMLDRAIRKEIEKKGLSFLLEDIGPVFKSADFGIVNLECAIDSVATPLTKQFVFLGNPEVLPELHGSGITHCILANNHSYDHGRETLTRTAHYLLDKGISPVGHGESQKAACAPVILKKGNIEIAVFASVTLGLESWMYLENEPGMCQATVGDLQNAIALYKAENSRAMVIVTLHWGAEYQLKPTSIQRNEAKLLIEAGADAIIGHHPHVVQSYESINGKPVFYSIGNLIFDNKNPLTHDGILVKIIIDENGSQSVKIIPYYTQKCKPLLMPESKEFEFMAQLQERSDPLPLIKDMR